MIVNKGFSFSNLVGMYEIKDDSKAFGNIFSNKAIVTEAAEYMGYVVMKSSLFHLQV